VPVTGFFPAYNIANAKFYVWRSRLDVVGTSSTYFPKELEEVSVRLMMDAEEKLKVDFLSKVHPQSNSPLPNHK